MLIPLPTIEQKNELDLGGLSWCGLPVRDGKIEPYRNRQSKGGQFPPIRWIEARRAALISMLNAVAADVVDPVPEAKKHQLPLVLAVVEALTKRQEKQYEKLKEQQKRYDAEKKLAENSEGASR